MACTSLPISHPCRRVLTPLPPCALSHSYSKAAQVIMTTEIQRRLLRGTDTIAVALEPGLSVESGLTDSSACLKCVMNYTPVGAVVGSIMGKSLPQMASTVLYASLADGVAGGDYFRNVNLADVHGPAADPAYGPQLWELSCKAVQAKVPLFSPPPPVTMAAPRG